MREKAQNEEKTILSLMEEIKSPEFRKEMEESYRKYGKPSPEDWQRRFTI